MVEDQIVNDPSRASKRRNRLGDLADRVPTRWVVSAVVLAGLGATAAFGGLEPAEPEPILQVQAGEDYRNEQLRLAVDRAVLIDALPEMWITPDPGQRVLTVILDVENLSAEPLLPVSSVLPTVVPTGVSQDEPARVYRYDDTTPDPILQPGVPAIIAMIWIVPEGDFSDGDDLAVNIVDQSYTPYRILRDTGGYWEGDAVSASINVPITDVGAGVET